jgi:hypothetical protein
MNDNNQAEFAVLKTELTHVKAALARIETRLEKYNGLASDVKWLKQGYAWVAGGVVASVLGLVFLAVRIAFMR